MNVKVRIWRQWLRDAGLEIRVEATLGLAIRVFGLGP